jgi:hypothetical protein
LIADISKVVNDANWAVVSATTSAVVALSKFTARTQLLRRTQKGGRIEVAPVQLHGALDIAKPLSGRIKPT